MIARNDEETFQLTYLDQNAARCYIQTLQVFPFDAEASMDVAVNALREALWATLQEMPFFAGTVGRADQKTGILPLRYPTQLSEEDKTRLFKHKVLTPDEFPATYAHLKERGMPPSALAAHMFCPEVLRDMPGVPPNAEGTINCLHPFPVLAVQAFFIQGGLVLSIYVSHNVVDCSGLAQLWKCYADSVSRLGLPPQPSKRSPPSAESLLATQIHEVPNQSDLRGMLNARIPDIENPVADLFVREPFEYSKTLDDDTPCSAKIFIICYDRIRALRDQLRNTLAPGAHLSICNVIGALVWISVCRARAARLERGGHTTTRLGVAVDCRKNLDPPLDENFMGAMAIFAKAELPLSSLISGRSVSHETILAAALEVRKTVDGIDKAWVERHLAFFKSKIPILDAEPALKFRFGPDAYLTSWLHFGADIKWNIPGTTSPSPDFIRRTTDNKSDGGTIILPRRKGGPDGKEAPFEVLVRLADEDMQRLEADKGGLRSWSEYVIQ
ncbi:trichothecene 3-O-acetyltransferas-like protein [Sporormia fimetaria CBS 119925]|uniref:Trichothecene 3-O-acetyltransferas-like protein n=1 Tax=Sporormia fimetaria CBS 119925 TaxID=1340428 RepID=A0A6A6UYV2_9PLEO|nr:trichothecene 3-O-acetyltransferas-like protein [Sporormia fimetaria CBS 119925]